jgi:hypothetical protein
MRGRQVGARQAAAGHDRQQATRRAQQVAGGGPPCAARFLRERSHSLLSATVRVSSVNVARRGRPSQEEIERTCSESGIRISTSATNPRSETRQPKQTGNPEPGQLDGIPTRESGNTAPRRKTPCYPCGKPGRHSSARTPDLNSPGRRSMSRVSRIIKAASVRPEAGANGQEREAAETDLPRLIACWSHMPGHYKQTIMALVEVVETKRRKAVDGRPAQ